MTIDHHPQGQLSCHECGELHRADYSHQGRFNEGPIYVVVCPVDDLTDFYTAEALELHHPETGELHRFHDGDPCFAGCPAWDSKR